MRVGLFTSAYTLSSVVLISADRVVVIYFGFCGDSMPSRQGVYPTSHICIDIITHASGQRDRCNSYVPCSSITRVLAVVYILQVDADDRPVSTRVGASVKLQTLSTTDRDPARMEQVD